jgi:hypothetical protein
VRRHFNPDRRNVEHWAFFMGGDRHRRQARPTLATGHHRVQFRLIRCRHPLQGVAPMSRLTPQRLLTGLAQTGGPLRLGIAVTGRRFTAVGAGLPQARLHLFQRRRLRLQLPRQLLHLLAHPCKQFHHRFLPFQEGAMDLVTGRQSKVHEVRINIQAAFGNPAKSGQGGRAQT